MQDLHILLLGFALGTIPSAELARLFVAFLGKRLGVDPREMRQYGNVMDDDSGGEQ